MPLEGVVVVEWLSFWLAEQEVRCSIPGLTTWISEISYLLLPSRDMAEIPLKRRKSSIQSTNQFYDPDQMISILLKERVRRFSIEVKSTELNCVKWRYSWWHDNVNLIIVYTESFLINTFLMKMSLIAQGFSLFQVISIPRDFDLKNIWLFPILISMKLMFHFLLHSVYSM